MMVPLSVVDFLEDSIDRRISHKAECVNLFPVVYNDDPRNFVTCSVKETFHCSPRPLHSHRHLANRKQSSRFC
jgi:hypothetical protein